MAMRQSTIDRLEDYDDLAAQGYTINQAAARLGMTRAALDKLLSRRRDEQPDTFDPEAIARRVAEREQAAPKPKPTGPMSRIEGSCVTGTGQATHVPLPRRNGVHHDPFAVINQAFERSRFVSPLDHRVHVALDDDPPEVDPRFVAPALEDDEPDFEEEVPAVVLTSVAEPKAPPNLDPPSSEVEKRQPTAKPHDPRCGQPLTGGGAPRGWVLMRIIGSGPPRRFCGVSCAARALIEVPAENAPNNIPAPVAEKSPKTRGETSPRRPTRTTTRSSVDVAEIARRYAQGQTAPEIGAALGHTPATVRRALDRAGVERRDDRVGHAGAKPKEYDEALVARVRRLYVAHGLTQDQVAEAIGTSAKVVQNIMARNGIEARPAANVPGTPGADRAAGLKQLMYEAGISSATVRAWADSVGMDMPRNGLPSRAAVDAYLAAHTEKRNSA